MQFLAGGVLSVLILLENPPLGRTQTTQSETQIQDAIGSGLFIAGDFLLPAGLVCLGALRRRLSRAGGASRFRTQIKTLALAIGIFATLSLTPRLHAQGSVFLNNYDSGMGLYVQLDEGSPIIPAPAGTSVMIFGGTTAASMAPITNSAGQSVFTVSPAGVELRGLGSGSYFDAGTGVVPGVPSNGTAFFAIHAWAYAPLFWDAVGYGVWRMSGVWQQAVGAPGAALPLNIPGEYAIILTPSISEPSTIAVAALGLAGWLAFRRRKPRQEASSPSVRLPSMRRPPL